MTLEAAKLTTVTVAVAMAGRLCRYGLVAAGTFDKLCNVEESLLQ
jgi:hypothetical protein